MNWIAGIWKFILDNPPLAKYLIFIGVYYVLLFLVVFRPPRFIKKYMHPDPDYEGIIREINSIRLAKDFPTRKLHAWQKERGI